MSSTAVIVATAVILTASAFFVAVEFALLAARRHRLEKRALTSRAARAALRSSADLTLVLAGAQLGITVCTLALGAITKPAVYLWLTVPLAAVGLPAGAADVAAFLLALFVVTFLHLVVGEMAPKSWAIARPELAAVILALPMQVFMGLSRPLLRLMNLAANWMLRRLGVEQVDELAAVQDPAGLRALVEHSANVGALAASYREPLAKAIDLRERTVAEILDDRRAIASVGEDARFADVHAASLSSGQLRILVVRADGSLRGAVHVRDTLGLDPDSPILPLIRDLLELDVSTPLHTALQTMREHRSHLAGVVDRLGTVTAFGSQPGRVVGVVSLSDILPELTPRD